MIFGSDHRVAAVIDWEVASIGPPEIDVGHWLFFDRFATDAVGVETASRLARSAATVARYEDRSGRVLGDLEWFEMLEELVIATTLVRQADARVARGNGRTRHAHGPRQHGHPDARPPPRAPASRRVTRLPRAPRGREMKWSRARRTGRQNGIDPTSTR